VIDAALGALLAGQSVVRREAYVPPVGPPPPSGITWQPDYSAVTDMNNPATGTSGWTVQQDPEVFGIVQPDRLQLIEQSALSAGGVSGWTYGRALRVDARPVHVDDVDMLASGSYDATATTLGFQSMPSDARLDAWLQDETNNEILRASANPSSLNLPVKRGLNSTTKNNAIVNGSPYVLLGGDTNDSGADFLSDRREVYGRRAATGSAPPGSWPLSPGTERWLRIRLAVPTDAAANGDRFPLVNGLWATLFQFKSQYAGSPKYAIGVEDGALIFERRSLSGTVWNGTQSSHQAAGHFPLDSSLDKGHIYTIDIHAKWATDTTGFMRVWCDGVQKVGAYEAEQTMYLQTGSGNQPGMADPVYYKQGIYRTKAWALRQVAYFAAPVEAYLLTDLP
jgi:hypothetical protein